MLIASIFRALYPAIHTKARRVPLMIQASYQWILPIPLGTLGDVWHRLGLIVISMREEKPEKRRCEEE
jgi:hypothetical protein